MKTRIFASFPADELLLWGGNYRPYTIGGGQFWRVVTYMFLHENLLHLGWNLLFLWRLGRLLDLLLGPVNTFAIYLFSGIGCALSSLCCSPTLIHVGASGGNAGLAGALICLVVFAKLNLSQRNWRSVFLWAALLTPIAIISGFRTEGVDSAGHLGGFVSGFLIGAVFIWRKPMGLLKRL
ncbi:MAG TPA: rhomboid family intramembrane serine protease [Candidatus Angelobacter sp.]|nr:rhomboid family intramembrane serine protease [Candidatus Angelobacter sp.]